LLIIIGIIKFKHKYLQYEVKIRKAMKIFTKSLLTKSTTTFLLTLLILIYLPFQSLHSQSASKFQLVESIPVETSLGSSKTLRTADVWLDMINSAKKSIEVEAFYISNEAGEPLEPIITAFLNAASRGVIIRFVIDDRMAGTYPETLQKLNQQPNITIRKINYYDKLGGVMHAKYFIVDDEQLFLGSQNFDWRALKHIHELGVKIRNSKISLLFKKIFEIDWELAANHSMPMLHYLSHDSVINRNLPLLLSDNLQDTISLFPAFSPQQTTYPQLEEDEREIIRLIDEAQEHLEIQLLSYKPVFRHNFYQNLDNALREAAVRGVQIHLIVSDWNTNYPDIQYLKSLQVIPNIDIHISKIPQWSGGFIPYARVEHCKYMVVDSTRVWIGTSNWGWNYFYVSRNAGLIIKSKNVNQTVHDIFSRSWNSNYTKPLDVSKEYKAPSMSGK
jgi:phosphatidylserine/phosphatidylglycerophosphate/cardiolipin synthase-like enzyme